MTSNAGTAPVSRYKIELTSKQYLKRYMEEDEGDAGSGDGGERIAMVTAARHPQNQAQTKRRKVQIFQSGKAAKSREKKNKKLEG